MALTGMLGSGRLLVAAEDPPPPGKILSPELSGGALRISIVTVSNQSYTVQANLDLTTTDWVDVTNVVGDGGIVGVTLPISSPVAQMFFRVRLEPLELPPTITQDPVSQRVDVGAKVTFSVEATGTPPLRYQWFHGATEITGANDPSYTLDHAQTPDTGSYTVKVENSVRSVMSQPAVLVVGPAPFIVRIGRSGPDVVLSWIASGPLELQAASSLAGGWSSIVTGTGPYTFSPLQTMQFFRAKSTEGANPVYSVNMVGYVRVHLNPGVNLIANPLLSGINQLNDILPLPDDAEGTTIARFDVGRQELGAPIEWQAGIGWVSEDPLETYILAPGEGFFITPLRNGTAASMDVVFIGEVPQGTLANALPPAGQSALKASIMILSAPLGDEQQPGTLLFPAEDGDLVFLWDNAQQAFGQPYHYVAGFGWDDLNVFEFGPGPTIAAGTGFMIRKAPLATKRQWVQFWRAP